MEEYIERLKQIKSEKKITNQMLSETTGIPIGTLSKMMAGMNDSPKISTMLAVCRALGVSLDYVMSGVPENTNNYTLSETEIRWMEKFRRMGIWERELLDSVMEKLLERTDAGDSAPVTPMLKPISVAPKRKLQMRSIDLYDLPVSAGTGVDLEDTAKETISIPNQDRAAEADFALRISGNSMEPKYHDGDVLLVQKAEQVSLGELGIFLLDGKGYFKVFGGDRLVSLNPEYQPILLKNYTSIQCAGRVLGKLRKK